MVELTFILKPAALFMMARKNGCFSLVAVMLAT